MSTCRRPLLLAVATVGLILGLSPLADAGPAASQTIHPGVQTYTNGGQCTANFIFTSGSRTFIGQAAHCSSTGASTDTDGCKTGSLPLGTPVTVLGASKPGTLAYNSWLTMQSVGETDANACAYNDLALVELDPADAGSVSASVPHWGGPVGLNTAGTTSGAPVYSYGNSILRGGVTLLSPKVGTSAADDPTTGGWTHVVTTVTPGIPGDSGSAFLDANGNALGDLSTVGVGFPDGVVNNVSDLNHELNYLAAKVGSQFPGLALSQGGAFNGNQAPLDTNHPVDDPVNGYRNFFGF